MPWWSVSESCGGVWLVLSVQCVPGIRHAFRVQHGGNLCVFLGCRADERVRACRSVAGVENGVGHHLSLSLELATLPPIAALPNSATPVQCGQNDMHGSKLD